VVSAPSARKTVCALGALDAAVPGRSTRALGCRSDRACRADRDLRAAAWLGGTYTLHGELMVVGGLMFGLWALRAWWR
jgi:hypothetical protein